MTAQNPLTRLDRDHLPYPVVLAAAWSACLLLIAGGAWLVAQAVGKVSVVVAPLAIAVLLAAMLRPLVDRGATVMPRGLATLATILGLIAVVAGGLTLVTTQVASGLPDMRDRLRAGTDSVLAWLSDGPLHLTADRLQTAVDQVRATVGAHSNELATGAIEVGHTAVDVIAGTLICLIALFFFLYHGEK
jgi:predicted PurR-regulated permease PerM